MSLMSDLDVCIQEASQGDLAMKRRIEEDICHYKADMISFGDMCPEAQWAVEMNETAESEDLHGSIMEMRALNCNEEGQYLLFEEDV